MAAGTAPPEEPGGTAAPALSAAGTDPPEAPGGTAAATSPLTGTEPEVDEGGTTPEDVSTTAAGGVDALAGGTLVTTFVEAGGTVTEAGGVPPVTEVVAVCNDSVTLPGFDAAC